MSDPAEPSAPTAVSPVRLEGTLDAAISPGLWLIKWLLLIPHLVCLAFLWFMFYLLTIVAFFAILITGRYPRPVFDLNLGVLRWSWRVGFYGYSALGTDRYPPFTLGEAPDYPARLDVEYPETLSRGLVLVKWWLLAIPHYAVLALFLGTGTYGSRWAGLGVFSFGTGLVLLLAVFAGVAVLFTRRYPPGIFDFLLGMDRWVTRVVVYVSLMTDVYPPFRLDQGGTEPAPR